MSAKHSKKKANKPAPAPAPVLPATPSLAADGGPAATAQPEPAPSLLESPDPRKRRIGRAVLAGVWVYVGALWLLALDQTFNWGIFGPKLPPMP
jgi:hypothetical protein